MCKVHCIIKSLSPNLFKSININSMKNLKLIFGALILGTMSYGGIVAYNFVTMTEQERFLIENIEALTQEEGNLTTGSLYHNKQGTFFCCVRDSNTKSCGAVTCPPDVIIVP